MSTKAIIELVEYGMTPVPLYVLSHEQAALLRKNFGRQVSVEKPWYPADAPWGLTSLGWVGQIPLGPDLELRLQPKTRLSNLFGMLEYAYNIRSLAFLKGVTAADSLQEFYSQLAGLLAQRVLERGRKGFYHTYRSQSDLLPYVRGRIDMAQAAARPWSTRVACEFQEHTADVDDNRILTWTLWKILRTGFCSEPALGLVRKAYRTVQAVTELQPCPAVSCVAHAYGRLNEDYRPIHALCRFFLDNSGPTHSAGKMEMTPFLVNMANLFELFVAAWLTKHLPERWSLKVKDSIQLDRSGYYRLIPDLVIYDRVSSQVRCVLDTKYKVASMPSTDDIYQVFTYAHLKESPEAVLVYPAPMAEPLDVSVPGIHVRSVTFDLGLELEEAGRQFLLALGLV